MGNSAGDEGWIRCTERDGCIVRFSVLLRATCGTVSRNLDVMRRSAIVSGGLLFTTPLLRRLFVAKT
jgi:hypothetical protein